MSTYLFNGLIFPARIHIYRTTIGAEMTKNPALFFQKKVKKLNSHIKLGWNVERLRILYNK